MGRGSNIAAVILLLLGVALLSLAAGDMRGAVLAGGGGKGAHHGIDEAVRRLRVSTRLEDVVAPELGMDDLGQLHQRVLGGGGTNSNGLVRNQQTCVRTCAGPGKPYIDRGCENVYGCQGSKGTAL